MGAACIRGRLRVPPRPCAATITPVVAAVVLCLHVRLAAAVTARSLSPKHGSLAGGTDITIEGHGLMSMQPGVDVYVGPLRCAVLPHLSSNEKLYCRTQPVHKQEVPGHPLVNKVVHSNWMAATLATCQQCTFQYGMAWTPQVGVMHAHAWCDG